jgi:hypothetical protein
VAFGALKGTLQLAVNSVANPTTAAGSVAVVVGDLVFAVLHEQATLTSTGATDNLGNTYTPVNAGSDAGAATSRAYYSRVTNAGTLTGVSIAATASTNNAVAVAAVIEGPFATSPLDANPANITNDTSSPYTCPATGTLAQASEVVMCWFTHASGGGALTATSPNLLAVSLATQTILTGAIGYQVVSATTSVAPAWTAAAVPTTDVLGTASFKAASPTGTGALASGAATSSGQGVSSSTGTGTPSSGAATASGAGFSSSAGTGALSAQSAAVAGEGETGTAGVTGSGAPAAQQASIAGSGTSGSIGSGAIAAASAATAGTGVTSSTGTAALAAGAASAAGAGVSASTGTGALAASAASVSGSEAAVSSGAGELAAGSASVSGSGEVSSEQPIIVTLPGGSGFVPIREELPEITGVLRAVEAPDKVTIIGAPVVRLRFSARENSDHALLFGTKLVMVEQEDGELTHQDIEMLLLAEAA